MSRLATGELLTRGIFPGELATVRVDAVSAHHARAFAALQRVEEPHPARRVPPCPNHEQRAGTCGGCALMALGDAAQRELKRDMLRRRFGLEVDQVVPASPPLGYRYSSKRVVLNVDGVLTLGSFARRSHAPAPMPNCLVDHPLLARSFDALEQTARALGIEPYDEGRDRGDLRAVWAKTDGERVIVTLVVRATESRAADSLPQALTGVAGVLVSVQDQPTNQLRGAEATLRAGQPGLGVRLLDHEVEVGALGFLQPNPRAAEVCYRALLAPSPGRERGDLAFDLYAGAGVTTRALREHYREVQACEAHPESAAQLGVEALSAQLFLARALARAPRRTPDLIVANPPRKGLGPDVVAQLIRIGAPELRIMSCGPEGLARDLQGLTGAGYRFESLVAFDTLPQTPHVELVARLIRC